MTGCIILQGHHSNSGIVNTFVAVDPVVVYQCIITDSGVVAARCVPKQRVRADRCIVAAQVI